MSTDNQVQKLLEKKEELVKERDRLLNELKTQHSGFYSWLVENNVDLKNLARGSVNIAAALTIIIKPVGFDIKTTPTPAPTSISQLASIMPVEPVLKIIQPDELKGLNEESKAKLVKDRYGFIVEKVAKKYEIDPNLIYATIMVESGGNTFAVRYEPQIGDASYGLGQLLYGTAKGLGFDGKAEDLFDPEKNIELIGRYHRRNLNAYGKELSPQQLTIAYNSGSPYNKPYPGHITKFNKWFEKVGNLLV